MSGNLPNISPFFALAFPFYRSEVLVKYVKYVKNWRLIITNS